MKLYAVTNVDGYYGEPFLEVYDIHDNLQKALESIVNGKNNPTEGNWHIIELVLNERTNLDFYQRLYGEPSSEINVGDISVKVYLHTEDQ